MMYYYYIVYNQSAEVNEKNAGSVIIGELYATSLHIHFVIVVITQVATCNNVTVTNNYAPDGIIVQAICLCIWRSTNLCMCRCCTELLRIFLFVTYRRVHYDYENT